MAIYCTMGAIMQCSFGMAPSQLMVVDPTRPTIQGKFKATVMDFTPMLHILPFGMCQSMANPTVASATAAAFGVLTPMPCVPVITAPWSPGGQQKINNIPALLNNCKCMCTWGGNISIINPGHTEMSEGK